MTLEEKIKATEEYFEIEVVNTHSETGDINFGNRIWISNYAYGNPNIWLHRKGQYLSLKDANKLWEIWGEE